MGESPRRLVQGSIAWVEAADPRGEIKLRPVVIITATHEMAVDQPVAAVAVTTSYASPAPRQCVELPWDPRKHPATQLRHRSAAVCNWIIELLPRQIVEIKGYIPTKTLLQINERVREWNEGMRRDG